MNTKRTVSALAAMLALAAATPAQALTGGDIVDKMNEDERGSYLTGSVEMAAFMAALEGKRQRADCIMDWLYNKKGSHQIIGALHSHKDRQALPVVHLVIKKACGE